MRRFRKPSIVFIHKNFIDIIAYSDGKNSLEDISKILKVKTKALNKYIKNLLKLKIIKKI